MNPLDDLYQEVILDHQRNLRNFARLATANRQAEGINPLCGDRVKVFLDVADGRIRDISLSNVHSNALPKCDPTVTAA